MNKLKKIALSKYLLLRPQQQAEISSLFFTDQYFREFVKLKKIEHINDSAYHFLVEKLKETLYLTTTYGKRRAYKCNYDEDRLKSIELWVPSCSFTSSIHGSYEPLGNVITCSSALAPTMLKYHEKKMLESWKVVSRSLGSHPMTSNCDYVAARLNYSPLLTDEQDVYFVLDHESQIVKIGITKHISGRLEAIKREYCTGSLTLLALIDGAGRKIEEKLHKKFASIQVKTKGKGKEWFHYNEEMKSFINRVNDESGMLDFFYD